MKRKIKNFLLPSLQITTEIIKLIFSIVILTWVIKIILATPLDMKDYSRLTKVLLANEGNFAIMIGLFSLADAYLLKSVNFKKIEKI